MLLRKQEPRARAVRRNPRVPASAEQGAVRRGARSRAHKRSLSAKGL